MGDASTTTATLRISCRNRDGIRSIASSHQLVEPLVGHRLPRPRPGSPRRRTQDPAPVEDGQSRRAAHASQSAAGACTRAAREE